MVIAIVVSEHLSAGGEGKGPEGERDRRSA